MLFDIDGTLVDSNEQHVEAWVSALGEAGFPVTAGDIRPLVGMGGDKIIPKLTGLSSDDPRGKAIGEREGAIFKAQYLPTVRPFSEIRPLVERMRDDGLAIVAATSAKANEVTGLLAAAGVRDLFDAAASHGDARHSKPNPGIVDAAIERAGEPPATLVMIGDTPYDVEAAARAGVRAVAFRCGGYWSDEDFRGAVAIYDGPWELLARYDEFRRLVG